MKSNIAYTLFISLIALSSACATGNKSAFHPPQTEAERALDALFEIDRAGDNNMYAYILGQEDYDPDKDPGYARFMTLELVNAVRQKEKSLVHENCVGKYLAGEICGIDIHLPVCGNDITDLGFLYRTLYETETEAHIGYIWIEHAEHASSSLPPNIKMKKQEGVWKLDGLDCGDPYIFNMQPYSSSGIR